MRRSTFRTTLACINGFDDRPRVSDASRASVANQWHFSATIDKKIMARFRERRIADL